MSKRLRSLLIPASGAGTIVSAALGALTLVGAAQAQEAVDSIAPAGPRPTVWIEPRVSAGLTLSDNGSLSSANPQSEQTIELSPGVRVVMNSPRVKGYLDYALSALFYAQDTSGDNLRHALNASATLNAWDNRAFLDVSGVVTDEAVSAFGTQTGGSLADVNRSETASFRFSPYLRGNIAGVADAELRYSLQSSDTEVASRSDATVQDLSLRLGSRMAGQTLGWSFDALSREVDNSLTRDTRSDSLKAGLIYAATPQLQLTLLAGVESNDILTLTEESYNTTGLNLEWRPSPRTRLFLGLEDRYFGRGHNVFFEHRTGRTVWRFADTRGAVDSPLEAASASLGSIYDLLDSLYTSIEPDPVQRAQLVQDELLRLGLPADTQIFQDFLASSATLERSQELSVALVGVRSVVTLAVSRTNSRRLDSIVTAGDDFDTNTRILQQGWNLNLAHRLTPLTAVSLALGSQKNEGTGSTLANRTNTLSLGLTTRLAPRTSGSLQLRRTEYDGASSYGETSIAGVVTHRF